MGDHRNEHRHHVAGAVLQSDGKALEKKMLIEMFELRICHLKNRMEGERKK